MPHRGENKRNSTLRCTKTGGIQPKLNVACFVQSCLTDADFVIFSNYCLIGTRPTASSFWPRAGWSGWTWTGRRCGYARPMTTRAPPMTGCTISARSGRSMRRFCRTSPAAPARRRPASRAAPILDWRRAAALPEFDSSKAKRPDASASGLFPYSTFAPRKQRRFQLFICLRREMFMVPSCISPTHSRLLPVP